MRWPGGTGTTPVRGRARGGYHTPRRRPRPAGGPRDARAGLAEGAAGPAQAGGRGLRGGGLGEGGGAQKAGGGALQLEAGGGVLGVQSERRRQAAVLGHERRPRLGVGGSGGADAGA